MQLRASRQLANALPVGAKDKVDLVFGGAAPTAELFRIAPGSDLRIATKPKWPAATITTYGHAKSTLLVLISDEGRTGPGDLAGLQRRWHEEVPETACAKIPSQFSGARLVVSGCGRRLASAKIGSYPPSAYYA